MVAGELPQLLVGKVDGDLLRTVAFKNLESGNVESSAEFFPLQGGINKSGVAFFNQKLEEAVKHCSGNATKSSGSLVVGLILDDPLGASLEPGLAEDLDHQVGRLAAENPTTLGPVVATPRLELNSAASHNTSSHQVAVELLLLREPDHIEDALRVEHLLVIVLPNALEEEEEEVMEEEEVAPRLARPR